MSKRLFALVAVLAGLANAVQTLDLTFTHGKPIGIAGTTFGEECTITRDGWLTIGKNGFSLPAQPLVKEESGTILFTCRFDQTQDTQNIQRNLVNIRTNTRNSAGFSFFHNMRYLFGCSDYQKTFLHRFEKPLEPGREYTLGFSWNGTRLRVYQDGQLMATGDQPVPLEKLTTINLGPYKDNWQFLKPWQDDTYLKNLKVYNHELSVEEVAQACNAKIVPLPQALPALLTVPMRPRNMGIDRNAFSAPTWEYAASFPRLVMGNFPAQSGQLPPHDFKLLYDLENLYIKHTVLFPPHSPLSEGALRVPEKEPEVWGTESVEVYIKTDAMYRFAGNVAGGYCESRNGIQEWNGAWQYAVSRNIAIDDTIHWHAIMIIPWKSLGLQAPPKEADLNLCHSWKLPECGHHSSLNVTGGTYAGDNMAKVRFEQGAVMQTLYQTDPNTGVYEEKLRIHSPLPGKLRYDLAVAKLDGSAQPMTISTKQWTMKAMEFAEETRSTEIDKTEYDCLVYTLYLNDKPNMRQLIPFKLDGNLFNITPLLLSGKVLVELKEAIIKSKMGADFVGQVTLTDQADTLRSQVSTTQKPLALDFNRDWPAGKYTVALQDNSGQLLASKEFTYPGYGEWEKQEFPNDVIVYPYSPMTSVTTKGALESEVVLRKYTWQDTLFPSTIESVQEQLLKEPIAMVIGGERIAAKDFTVKENKPHRVAFKAIGEGNSGSCSNEAWLEYDGFLWNEVEVLPRKNHTSVELQIALDNRYAKYMLLAAASGWGSKITQAVPMGKSSYRYFPVIWIGNEEKGLCFFSENRNGWTADPRATFQIEKDKDKTVLTVKLGSKIQVGQAVKYGLGLLATPMRPLPPDYPYNTFGWSYATKLNRPGKAPTTDIMWNINNQLPGVPCGDLGSWFADTNDKDGNDRATEYQLMYERVYQGMAVRPVPYTCALYLSAKYPEMAAYKAEWSIKPELAMDYEHTGHFVHATCPTTSANLLYMYKAKQLLKRFPFFKGLYFDFGNVPECTNELHGCHANVPLRAMREFYRRINMIQLEVGIKDPLVLVHNTDNTLLPIYTFVSHILNGEQVRQASSSLLHNKKDILDTYGLEMFAAELGTLPFGVVNSAYFPLDNLLPQYGGNEDFESYQFRLGKAEHAGILLHNGMFCMMRNHYGQFDKILRTYRAFGVGAKDCRFIGYWREPVKVTGASDIYVSCHVRNGKVLAVVGHLGKPHINQTFDLTFNWKQLGITSPLSKYVDAMTAPDPDYDELFQRMKEFKVPVVRAPLKLGDFGSKVISFDGNTLRMSLDYHSFAIIILE